MIRVCEPWLHTRLNTVYACIHLDLALPPRTRPRHGAPPEGEGPARRLQGAGGESGTPTRTAPTARTTSSTWPSRARAASCEARGSEGGRAQRECGCTRYRGGGVSGLYAHYSRFRGRLSAYMYSCIIQVHTHAPSRILGLFWAWRRPPRRLEVLALLEIWALRSLKTWTFSRSAPSAAYF